MVFRIGRYGFTFMAGRRFALHINLSIRHLDFYFHAWGLEINKTPDFPWSVERHSDGRMGFSTLTGYWSNPWSCI